MPSIVLEPKASRLLGYYYGLLLLSLLLLGLLSHGHVWIAGVGFALWYSVCRPTPPRLLFLENGDCFRIADTGELCSLQVRRIILKSWTVIALEARQNGRVCGVYLCRDMFPRDTWKQFQRYLQLRSFVLNHPQA